MKRITMAFIYGIQGWSESWYADAIPSTPQLTAVASGRLLNLNQSSFLVDVRASDMDGNKDVTTGLLSCSTVNPWPGVWGPPAGTTGDFITAPHDAQSAVLYTVKCGATHSIPLKLLGLPDEVISNNAINPASLADVENNVNIYLAAVKSAGMGFRHKSGEEGRADLVKFGTQTADDPGVNFTFTGPAPLKDQHIQLKEVKPFNYLNGEYKVAYVTEGKVYLSGTSKIRAFGNVDSGYSVRNTFTVLLPDSAKVRRVGRRKVGLPFDVQRGRR